MDKARLARKLGIYAVTIIMTVAIASLVQAKKPLVGEMDLEFNLDHPGPQDLIPDWVGTITIDGEEYGMLFFAIGSGKSFDDFLKGKVHFFEEIWAIYDTDVDFTTMIPTADTAIWDYWRPINNPEELVLWGYDEGLTNTQNLKYHMNGNVVGASGSFAQWEGRNVYMSGLIVPYSFGAPHFAPGSFRIN